MPKKSIILEPEGKNTGPAIALGALKAFEEDENSVLLILSADHIIKDISIFTKALEKGFKYALQDNLVTFGIVPNYAETGYGYIEGEDNLNNKDIEVSKIKKFIEKPKKERLLKN